MAANSAPLKLYIKPGCPWCHDAIRWLTQAGYEFEKLDVYSDPTIYAEMREISGQSLAPTLSVGDLVLADFGVDELIPFLKEHDIQPS